MIRYKEYELNNVEFNVQYYNTRFQYYAIVYVKRHAEICCDSLIDMYLYF